MEIALSVLWMIAISKSLFINGTTKSFKHHLQFSRHGSMISVQTKIVAWIMVVYQELFLAKRQPRVHCWLKFFVKTLTKKAKSVQETCYCNNLIRSNNTLISNITIFLGEFPETQNIDVFDWFNVALTYFTFL